MPQAHGPSPDAAAAELGASNCVRHLSITAVQHHEALTPETLEVLSRMLHRRTATVIADPCAARYLLIGNLALLLSDVWNSNVRNPGWIMPLKQSRDLWSSATLMGAAAAAQPKSAGGCAASADALATFVRCCTAGCTMSFVMHHHIQLQKARTAHIAFEQLMQQTGKQIADLQRAQGRQLITMVQLLGESASQGTVPGRAWQPAFRRHRGAHLRSGFSGHGRCFSLGRFGKDNWISCR